MRYNSTSKPTNTSPRIEEKRRNPLVVPFIIVLSIAVVLAVLFIVFTNGDRLMGGDDYSSRRDLVPPTGYKRYESDVLGMSFVLSDTAKELDLQNYDLAYRDNGFYFYVNAMSYQELEESTYNNQPDPWRTDVKGYSRDFIIKNGISEDNLYYNEEENFAVITDTYIDSEYQYYDHYLIMDNGEAIYLINFNCPASEKENLEDLFDDLDDYVYVSQR